MQWTHLVHIKHNSNILQNFENYKIQSQISFSDLEFHDPPPRQPDSVEVIINLRQVD